MRKIDETKGWLLENINKIDITLRLIRKKRYNLAVSAATGGPSLQNLQTVKR